MIRNLMIVDPFLNEEFQAMVAVMESWQELNNDIHFDTDVRIIINGVRVELDDQTKMND